ncbi:MAG: alpha/beta hydrolase [Bacilli bacterium]|nr:alpha/beta hydrolase [Bacilli bacterium]
MKKLVSNVIKKISNSEFSVKKTYKLFRVLQKIVTKPLLKNNNYEDITFDLKDRTIKSRIFYPSSDKKGLIIFIHGGGWVTGSIESYTKTCIELSNKTKRIVISIDYRLAPEYPYPNGFDDCYEVIRIIMNNIDKLNLREKDVCLMGDSAGGNLVAAITIKSKHTKDFKISKQILFYPTLQSDYSNNTKYKSVIEKGKDYLLTQKRLQEYISLYVSNPKDLNSSFVSPLKVKFPFFYPSTLIITADNDPLRDEGIRYAKKLKRYFNHVKYYNFEGAMHGFMNNPFGKKYKEEAYEKTKEFLGDIDESKK